MKITIPLREFVQPSYFEWNFYKTSIETIKMNSKSIHLSIETTICDNLDASICETCKTYIFFVDNKICVARILCAVWDCPLQRLKVWMIYLKDTF